MPYQPFFLVNKGEQTIPERLLFQNSEVKEREARRLGTEELRRRALENESVVVSNRQVYSNVSLRDPFVAEYAKRQADGRCQLCGQEAPFKSRDGKPYLECHHIEWVSAGGSDTIENTVALCPNCYRKMHALNLNSDRELLLQVISENEY